MFRISNQIASLKDSRESYSGKSFNVVSGLIAPDSDFFKLSLIEQDYTLMKTKFKATGYFKLTVYRFGAMVSLARFVNMTNWLPVGQGTTKLFRNGPA